MTLCRILLVASSVLVAGSAFADPGKTQAPAKSSATKRSARELSEFAKTFLDRGHPEAAIGLLEEAVAQEPDYAEAYMLLGDAYALGGRNDKAVEAYEKFLALAPLDPRAKEVTGFVRANRPSKPGKSG